MNWEKTCQRYVAFLDLPGSKDKMLKNTYPTFLKKATENIEWFDKQKTNINIESDQTKSLILPDSIILFSKGSSVNDFLKILMDSYSIRKSAIKNNIVLTAAISFGNITIDFDESVFWGQPIIDARLLHEDLFFLNIVLDDKAQKKVNSYKNNNIVRKIFHFNQVKMEFGSVTHTIISTVKKELIEEDISLLNKFYRTTSAVPRLYVDNTIDYYRDVFKIQN